jgi:Flagellar transcriptional activator (FlhC)
MGSAVRRSTEDQYARELRRVSLAQQMLRYRVRQSWVQEWTGCSDRRIRLIYRSTRDLGESSVRRGPLPFRASRILSTSLLLRSEASAIAGLAQRFGMLPTGPVQSARRLMPGLMLGERLCWLYEVYREWVPDATLSMEQFLLLVLELAEQKTIFLSRCDSCNGFWVIDKLEARHRQCCGCTSAGRRSRFKKPTQRVSEWTSEPTQESLF